MIKTNITITIVGQSTLENKLTDCPHDVEIHTVVTDGELTDAEVDDITHEWITHNIDRTNYQSLQFAVSYETYFCH